MSTLSNRSLDASYVELLKIDPTGGVNTGISASLANVETGNGTASALRLSSAQVHSTGTLTSAGLATLNSAAVTNNATIGGTLGVTGLLTATGGVGGALTGNVTGNVAGNVTGNVAGNLTGNVNGTIGATTPNSGSFTTLGASGASTLSSLSATNLTVSGEASFTGSGGLKMPVGATAGATGRPITPVQGMLRYNTSLNQFEGYDGSSWAPIASGGGGGGGGGQTMYVRQTFTATATQTTFTITGGYTAYKLDVFQNGVKLVNSDVGISRDVDVSNGATIVLATGAAAGDVVDVIGLSSGSFAGPATARRQTYTATAAQTVFTVSGGYTVGQLDVFQNGTKLVTAIDVDVGNGTTFTLTTPAIAGDTLEVVGFTAADTVSGTLQFQAGTEAAPSITTFGDTNTGIFFPAADTIAFSEGGAEAMRIGSSGNVGVGTDNPVSKLHIKDGTNYNLLIRQQASKLQILSTTDAYAPIPMDFLATSYGFNYGAGGTNALTIASSGNVGIGISSPATQLQINSSATTYSDQLRIRNTNFGNADIGVGSGIMAIATDTANITFHTSSNLGTTGSAVPNNERLRIDASGNLLLGATSITGLTPSVSAKTLVLNSTDASLSGAVSYVANGTVKAYHYVDSDGLLAHQVISSGQKFYTNNTESLRIDSSGRVGIGTTNPISVLDMSKASDTGERAIRVQNSSSDLYVGIEGTSGNRFSGSSVNNVFFGTTGAAGIEFATNNTVRAKIDSSGKVLVGGTTAFGVGVGGITSTVTSGANLALEKPTGGGIAFYQSGVNTSLIQDASSQAGLQFYTGTSGSLTERLSIDSSGGVTIAGLAGSGSRAVNASAAGLLSAASDASLKEEVVGASIAGLNEILQIHPKMYRWKDDIANRGDEASVELGFIANDVAPIIPSAAPMGNDGLYGFYDRSITAALVKAVQELSAKVTALEAA